MLNFIKSLFKQKVKSEIFAPIKHEHLDTNLYNSLHKARILNKLVFTTKGYMEEDDLEKTTGGMIDDNENTTWVEYRLNGELVHRSVHVRLKKVSKLCFVKEGMFNG